MRIFIFVPGLSEKYRSGGLMVLQNLQNLFSQDFHLDAQFVTTHEETAPLEKFIAENTATPPTCIVSWGPLIEKHFKLIRKHQPFARIIYYAQSFGWGMKLPRSISIACVSRYVMSQCAIAFPENELSFIPPFLQPSFTVSEKARDIDILVHTRKQIPYCTEQLITAFEKNGLCVEKISTWISQEEFARLLRRAKIFLYMTGTHKAGLFKSLPAEGLGLPALEAAACGTLVASNFLGGVCDFLTPGENAIHLIKNLNEDLARCKIALHRWRLNERAATSIQALYSRELYAERWRRMLAL